MLHLLLRLSQTAKNNFVLQCLARESQSAGGAQPSVC